MKTLIIGNGKVYIVGGRSPKTEEKTLIFKENKFSVKKENIGKIEFIKQTEGTEEIFDNDGDFALIFKDDESIEIMKNILDELKNI